MIELSNRSGENWNAGSIDVLAENIRDSGLVNPVCSSNVEVPIRGLKSSDLTDLNDLDITSKSKDQTVNITQLDVDFITLPDLKKYSPTTKPNRNVNMVSENVLEERPKYSWKDCTFPDGKFKINYNDLKKMQVELFTFNNALHSIIKSQYEKEVNNICVINVYSTTNLKSGGFTIYAYCTQFTCCSFVFKINRLYEVQVYRNKPELIDNIKVQMTSQCRNYERYKMQKEMQHIKPFNMGQLNVQRVSEEICRKGNLQSVKTKSKLRK